MPTSSTISLSCGAWQSNNDTHPWKISCMGSQVLNQRLFFTESQQKVLRWRVKLLDDPNDFEQCLHLNDFSPECICRCLVKFPLTLKVFRQCWHLNGFSPVCVLRWLASIVDVVKASGQCWHLNGISPICVLRWACKWLSDVNNCWQYWQFFPVCFFICFLKLDDTL